MRIPECKHDYYSQEKKIITQHDFKVEVGYCKLCGEELSRKLISQDNIYTQKKWKNGLK